MKAGLASRCDERWAAFGGSDVLCAQGLSSAVDPCEVLLVSDADEIQDSHGIQHTSSVDVESETPEDAAEQ